MISKGEFASFIEQYQKFNKAIERLEKAIFGNNYGCDLFESDWYTAVGKMFDIFLDSHFTVDGADWVCYYLFEDIDDKLVTVKDEDLFGSHEIEYHLNSIDELWDFLITYKEDYFKK